MVGQFGLRSVWRLQGREGVGEGSQEVDAVAKVLEVTLKNKI